MAGELDVLAARVTEAERAANALFMATGVALVMLMQAGFGALEVGAVRTKNTRSLMLKNVIDFSVGTIMFWLVGYGVAFPGAGARGFALPGNVAEVAGEGAGVAGEGSFLHFALLLAYASTSTTIVSGALAERTRLSSYVVFAALAFPFMSGLPMRWTWSHEGWLNAAARDGGGAAPQPQLLDVGVVDFAGSGVVHMVGGVAAGVGSWMVGPRLDERGVARFAEGCREGDFMPHAPALSTLGALILWFCWYAFNAASALGVVGSVSVVARVVVTTTLAAAASGCSGFVAFLVLPAQVQPFEMINCLLAGLVAVTAGCPVLSNWAAVVVGVLAAAVYLGSSRLARRMGVDDPVDAAALHGCCGALGVLMAGLLADAELLESTYGAGAGRAGAYGVLLGGGWRRMGAQVVGVCVYGAWGLALSLVLFGALKRSRIVWWARMKKAEQDGLDLSLFTREELVERFGNGLRVCAHEEMSGIDVSYHDGLAYPPYLTPFIDSINVLRELQLASMWGTLPIPPSAPGEESGRDGSEDADDSSARGQAGSTGFDLLLRPRVTDSNRQPLAARGAAYKPDMRRRWGKGVAAPLAAPTAADGALARKTDDSP